MSDTQILIAGAGPTGLVLALWLARLGVKPRIIDKTAEPGTTSRALAVQGRTLELYRQIGLGDEVVARGRTVTALNLWVSGAKKAHAVIGEIGAGLSPYSYALVFPQDEHEQLLVEKLKEHGIDIERRTELTSFEQTADGIIANLRRPDGTSEECRASYLAGCDGAHSAVRQGLGIGFPGGTYEHLFFVADVEASGPVVNGELHVGLDRSDFLAVFPLKRDGHARLVGTVRDAAVHGDNRHLTWNDVNQRVIEWMNIQVKNVNWFSTYHVHHRVAGHFRGGRAFLLGDAAHIHSPVGGQGMNTGIGDAVNLAWKLAAVVNKRAHPRLLDSYEPERIAFARRLVATTDQGFVGVTSSSLFARTIRLYLVPLVFPPLFATWAMRRFLFRTISQIAVNYRHSPLSAGPAAGVHPGDRLPWERHAGADGRDNFAALTSVDWQVHVYGNAAPELTQACETRNLPVHVYAWRAEMESAGLQQDAAYLIRPDGYVALTLTGAAATGALANYLDGWGVKSG